MLLSLSRPEVQEAFPKLWGERDALEIRLPKLGGKACDKLLEVIGGAGFDATTRAWLNERAEGNPFFLEELVRGLRSRDGDRRLPDTILGIVQARLDLLGEDAKLLIRAGSVFGQVFQVDGVQALLGGNAARLDMQGKLELLVEREVIFPRGSGAAREYVFRHALVREAAYMLLSDQDRRVAHRLAGEWLELTGCNEPALLADHYERGGVLTQAALWYRSAAAFSYDAGSLQDVVRFGERAVACGAEGPLFGEVACIVAEALSYEGDNARAGEWARRAREHLKLGGAAWWRATQVLIFTALRSGTLTDGLLEQLSQTAPAAPGQVAERAKALLSIATEAFRLARRELGMKLLSLVGTEAVQLSGGRAAGSLATSRAVLELSDGNFSASARYAQEALDAFRSAGATRHVCDSLNILSYVLCELGDHQQAEPRLMEAAQTAQRLGMDRHVADAKENLGLIHLRRGEWDQAERVLQEAEDGYAHLGLDVHQATPVFYRALVRAARGDLDFASSTVERALTLSASEPGSYAAALSVEAQVELLRGHAEAALAASEKAMELMRAHQLWERVARMRLVFAESLLACGHRERAKAAIAEARDWLLGRASRLDGDAQRAPFLQAIPEHARILQLADSWLTTS